MGFHADDEFLFDGLNQDVTIVSLSLCEGGHRRFLVTEKQKPDFSNSRQLDLGHGDIMTMEGLCQLFYLHAVWPGDRYVRLSHLLAPLERTRLCGCWAA